MKVKLFIIILFLLSFAACENDSKDISDEGASAIVMVTGANGNPVSGKKVNMYADPFPDTFLNRTFYHDDNDLQNKTFISSTESDMYGIASFTIDGKLLCGYARKFYFSCDDFNNSTEALISNGDIKGIQLAAGTSQSQDNIQVNHLTIVANYDGTITIKIPIPDDVNSGEISLYDQDGFTVWTKNLQEYDNYPRPLTIETTELPIGLYDLAINGERTKTIGEIIEYVIGASKSELGSYLSIINNQRYLMEQAKEDPIEVIAISSDDGHEVIGLKKGIDARNAEVAAHSGKVAFFHNGQSVDTAEVGDFIITESGCLCKILSIENDALECDAIIRMATIKNNDYITVELENYFSK